jgi:hypothetical protein
MVFCGLTGNGLEGRENHPIHHHFNLLIGEILVLAFLQAILAEFNVAIGFYFME